MDKLNKLIDTLGDRITGLGEAIPKYAKAKAERIYIEQFRKSKKAMLMRDRVAMSLGTQVAREQYAYSHPEYIELLDSLKEATEIEEKCKWALERLKIEVDVWRTIQANNRFTDSAAT